MIVCVHGDYVDFGVVVFEWRQREPRDGDERYRIIFYNNDDNNGI